MNHLSKTDERLVSRYLDGALSAEERATVERRLLQEPALREVVEEHREVREWFAADRADAAAAPLPTGFTARVMDRVRDQPARVELAGETAVLGELERDEFAIHRTARVILAAAAIVLGISLLFASGLMQRSDPGQLEAADVQRIEAIDRAIEAAEQRRTVEQRRR